MGTWCCNCGDRISWAWTRKNGHRLGHFCSQSCREEFIKALQRSPKIIGTFGRRKQQVKRRNKRYREMRAKYEKS